MADWLSSFRYAFRTLRRQPTFVLIALLTLTLGIGANTALFSVIRAVVLNPLPYQDPEKIAVLWEVNPDGVLDRVSVPDVSKTGRQTPARWSRSRPIAASISRSPDPASRKACPAFAATPELFAVLKAPRVSAGPSSPSDGVFGAPRVVVLSDAFWRRVLGAEPGIVGRTDRAGRRAVHGRRRHAAGVRVPDRGHAQLWTPLTFDPKDLHGRSRRARSLMVVGRIAPTARPDRRRKRCVCWPAASPPTTTTATRVGARASSPPTSSSWPLRVPRC